jgi:hypothetical protein
LCTAGDLALSSGVEFRGAFRVGPDARRARRIHALNVEETMQTSTARIQPDPRRWWALALLCGAFFMVILDAAKHASDENLMSELSGKTIWRRQRRNRSFLQKAAFLAEEGVKQASEAFFQLRQRLGR